MWLRGWVICKSAHEENKVPALADVDVHVQTTFSLLLTLEIQHPASTLSLRRRDLVPLVRNVPAPLQFILGSSNEDHDSNRYDDGNSGGYGETSSWFPKGYFKSLQPRRIQSLARIVSHFTRSQIDHLSAISTSIIKDCFPKLINESTPVA